MPRIQKDTNGISLYNNMMFTISTYIATFSFSLNFNINLVKKNIFSLQ